MHDARDAEDSRLLEAGEYTLLVESYYGVVLDRCRARAPPEGAGQLCVVALTPSERVFPPPLT
jgi:hypothetical protein